MAMIPSGVSWADIPEVDRAVASAHRNARSSVAAVRQGLSAADPTGARGFEVDADTEALRGTFRLVIPLLDTRGRGEPLRLALHYQARIWFGESEASMTTLDGDQLNAPGWSLGLPKVLGGILIEGDGSRHSARRVSVTGNGQEDVAVAYATTDGSDITYEIALSPTGATSARGVVRYPDGSLTVVEGSAGTNEAGGTSVLFTRLYATAMVDPHGNTTTIEYKPADRFKSAPRAARLIDPLGREVTFHYSTGRLLTAITAPAFGGGDRVLARLTYRSVDAYYAIDASDPAKDKFCYVGSFLFDDPHFPVGGPSQSGWRSCSDDPDQHRWGTSVVQGIFFPATGTGYWFGEADSYNQFAMVTKVVEQAGMTHTAASLTEQGVLTPGAPVRTRVYDFPKGPPATGDRHAFPQYKNLTETISGVSAPLVTHYEVHVQTPGAKETTVTVTLPDGARRSTVLDTDTGLPSTRALIDKVGALASSEEYVWQVGNDKVPRLSELVEADPLGRKKRTSFSYNAQGRIQDVRVRDWAEPTQAAPPLLRWLRYEYVADSAYSQRGIRGLVRRTETYDGSSLLPEERTDFEYDGLPLQPTPGMERNIFVTPGFRPDLLAAMPASAAHLQGLLTSTVRWTAPQMPGNTDTVTTGSRYTAAGLLAEVKVAGLTRSIIDYSPAGRYAFPETITLGARVPKSGSATVTSRLTWDVGTGALESLRRPSMGVVRFGYDDTMRLTRIHNPRASDLERAFAPSGLAYTDTTRASTGAVSETVLTEVDGMGRTRRILGARTGLAATECLFDYDMTGRLTRFAKDGVPGSGPLWTTLYYDSAGRVERTVLADGSVNATSHSRDDLPPGIIATGTVRQDSDAWGRSRYVVTDALGRTVQVLEPLSTATGWTATRYSYDARSNLLAVHCEANSSGTAAAGRRFQYDGLSRLTFRYLIERSPTLNGAGHLAAPAIWSDAYRYDQQSQLIEHVDPRGVVINYDYRTDPLGRLFSIRVTIPDPSPAGTTIFPVPETRLHYMRSGNPLRLRSARSVGFYVNTYLYDAKSRLEEISTTFADRPLTPVRQRVTRDPSGHVDTYAVGTPAEPDVQIRYTADSSGRDFQVSGTDVAATNWSVTATFATGDVVKQLLYEQAGWKAAETFSYDLKVGHLVEQKLTVNGNPVMNFDYYFDDATRARVYGPSAWDTSATAQLLAVRDNLGGTIREYGYDVLSRLLRVVTGPVGFEYAYDAAGNRRTTRTVEYGPNPPLHGTEQRTYPPDFTPPSIDLGDEVGDGQRSLAVDLLTNRITNDGYAFDAAGNTTRLPRKDGTVLVLDYDGLGRLRRIKESSAPDSDAESYRYNHNDQLIVVRRADGSSRYSGWRSAADATHFEASGPSAPLHHSQSLATLGGRPVARRSGPTASATTEFLHSAADGSATTVPGNAALLRTARLGPYGYDPTVGAAGSSHEARHHTYSRNRFGLDYAVNRYYDPETGRFLQTDPLGQAVYEANDPQSLNLYAFTRDDPVNRRDPLGLDCSDGGADGDFTCGNFLLNAGETVIHAQKGDTDLLGRWGWGTMPWTFDPRTVDGLVDATIDKALEKKLRQAREKLAMCDAAAANFAVAGAAYGRADGAMRIQVATELANDYTLTETIADSVKDVSEGIHSPVAGTAIVTGRGAAFMANMKARQAAQISRAYVTQDLQAANRALTEANKALNDACK